MWSANKSGRQVTRKTGNPGNRHIISRTLVARWPVCPFARLYNFLNMLLRNRKRGQISIFMALIFPVLFVFFAMTINIGLLVHDKINLQNSADLAAYYAAQKQAEILNAIAHLNYQLRQNWKLLAFRIRGFGNFGFHNLHNNTIHPWREKSVPREGDWGGEALICTQHSWGWRERSFRENLLYDPNRSFSICQATSLTISGISIPSVTPSILNQDFNKAINIQSTVQFQNLEDRCLHYGTTNWFTGAMWLLAYKKALIIRKIAIVELAKKLRDGEDLRGDSIEDGARNTFVNNLTRSNRRAFNDSNFEFFNSMEGIERPEWLVERQLRPIFYYSDSKWNCPDPNGNVEECCLLEPEYLVEGIRPQHYLNAYNQPDLRQLKEQLEYFVDYPVIRMALPDDPLFYINNIVGYEKNPWMMVYAGVRVQTSPQEPFSPLTGGSHTLTAKAFAKPFGGRIGPWMFLSWPSDETKSEGDPVDVAMKPGELVQDLDPRPTPSGTIGFATPNYSRYPGDPFGLNSHNSVSIYNSFFPLSDANKLSYDDFWEEYPLLPTDFTTSEDKYDPLIWRRSTDDMTTGRILEVMAISPDLFDITYYSIDPQFYINHLDISNQDLIFRRLTFDFGARPNNNLYRPDQFGVFDQWAWMNDLSKGINPSFSYAPVGRLGAWVVQNWKHLLTGWIPSARADTMFGQCDSKGDITEKPSEFLPGSCGIGGRVGYSVKLISKRYLTSNDLELGGRGLRGKIKNPPPF